MPYTYDDLDRTYDAAKFLATSDIHEHCFDVEINGRDFRSFRPDESARG